MFNYSITITTKKRNDFTNENNFNKETIINTLLKKIKGIKQIKEQIKEERLKYKFNKNLFEEMNINIKFDKEIKLKEFNDRFFKYKIEN